MIHARATLLIEYIYHEEEMKMSVLADITGIQEPALHQHNISNDRAKVLIDAVYTQKPDILDRFDYFYGWKPNTTIKMIKEIT